MKKLVLLAVVGAFVAAQAGIALAANPDTGPGCGLGKIALRQMRLPLRAEPASSYVLHIDNGEYHDTIKLNTSASIA